MVLNSENEMERNGYVMVTPRSERAVWPTLNGELNVLDYPMTFTGMGMSVGGNAAGNWLGLSGEGMSPFQGQGGGMHGSGEGGAGDGQQKNHELDFFSFRGLLLRLLEGIG
jgi:hypothetical protein